MTVSFMATMAQTTLGVSIINTQTPSALTVGLQVNGYGNTVPRAKSAPAEQQCGSSYREICQPGATGPRGFLPIGISS